MQAFRIPALLVVCEWLIKPVVMNARVWERYDPRLAGEKIVISPDG